MLRVGIFPRRFPIHPILNSAPFHEAAALEARNENLTGIREMIVFAHLLNDHSGSPRMLLLVVKSLKLSAVRRDALKLFVGSGGDGLLCKCGIPMIRYWYRRSGSRLVTLLAYSTSQWLLFWKLVWDRTIDRNAVVYVNTLLPFGAALYGWITKRPVVYHIHEISISPAPFRWLLTSVCKLTSKVNIFVSGTHRDTLAIRGVSSKVVYNALDSELVRRADASHYLPRRREIFHVLMVASLRDYKGVPELLRLCERLSGRKDVQFHLVANDDADNIERYFRAAPCPGNLIVHPRAEDPSKFYEAASLLLNLSRPDLWVETFGLTILEAMTFGVPVIVPPIGGPCELVTEGVEGFLVDCRDEERLEKAVLRLADDEQLCMHISTACRVRARNFSEKIFAESIREVLDSVAK